MGKFSFHITDYLPILSWLPAYFKSEPQKRIGGDVVAGLTVGVLIMPQAIAYAQLAGLPPVQGLYSALVPMFIYFFFGSTRQLSVGPVSMVSLSIAAALNTMEDVKTEADGVKYAIVINFIVGITYIIMGFVHLGNIIDYIETPIISGFTSAAAVIVIVGQLPSLLGLQIVDASNNTFILFVQSLKAIGTIRIIPCVMAMISLAVNVFIVKNYPSLPSSLIITIGTAIITWIVYLFTKSESIGSAMFYIFSNFGGTLIPETVHPDLQAHMSKYKFMNLTDDQAEKFAMQYLPVIGSIPAGLPHFELPHIFGPNKDVKLGFWVVTPVILVILLGFMESISIAKKYSEILKIPLNSNQELIALGLANLGGSFFSCYSVAGSFSRTAVNQKSGATSLFASLITASLLAVFLYGFTGMLYYVPKCTLAVILFLAVYGLIDFKLIKKYIKNRNYIELIYFFGVFLATCCFSTKYGLIVGAIFNILHMIVKKVKGESITPQSANKDMNQSTEMMLHKEKRDDEDSSLDEQDLRLMEEDPKKLDDKKGKKKSDDDFEEIEMQQV